MAKKIKVLMLISNGFEEVEALTAVDLLRRAGIVVDMCSTVHDKIISGSHGVTMLANSVLPYSYEDGGDFDAKEYSEPYDAVVLPGGMPNSVNLRDDPRVIGIVKAFDENKKIVAAICAAPLALEAAGLLVGKKATSYPDTIDEKACEYIENQKTVVCENIITGRGVGTAIDFALTIISELGLKEKAEEIAKGIIYCC